MSLLSPNLEAFFTVAKLGSVSGAAKELGITQTGVTQRLRSLERELGVTLFLRSRVGMKVTAEGEAVLRYCRGAEQLEGPVLSQLWGAGQHTDVHVTFAGPTSIMNSRIVLQMIPVLAEFPALYLHFLISDSEDMVSYLRTGQATLAILQRSKVPLELDSKVLRPEKYVLVASAKWKSRKLEQILQNERIIDFHENDSTTQIYLKKFDLDSQVGKPRMFANTNEAIIHLFKAGLGYGVLTKEIASKHIARGELIALNYGQVVEEQLALAWYPRAEQPEYFSKIIKAVK